MAEFPDFERVEREIEHLEAQFKQANEEIDRKAGRPLLPAILTGLALGAIAIVGLIFPIVFGAFATLLAASAAFELATALRQSGRRVPRIPIVVVTVGMIAAAFLGGVRWHWLALLIGAAVLILWRLVELLVPRLRAGAGQVVFDIGASLFTLAYVPFLVGFTMLLITAPDGWRWLLGFLIIVVVCDIAAYGVGRSLGRHPMAPKVSPHKSWEGFAGAGVAALIAGVVDAWLLLAQPWWFGLIFALVLFGSATLGDLAESLIKRDLGVKDMSSWLPGHGGILDRVDGILLSAPFAYLLYLLAH